MHRSRAGIAHVALLITLLVQLFDGAGAYAPNAVMLSRLSRNSPPRCRPEMAKKASKASKAPGAAATKEQDTEAARAARKTLLAEIAQDSRSLANIEIAIKTLEGAPAPTKIKKVLLGDWKLVFASDQDAIKPFAIGAASGPFTVLEDIYHRILVGDSVQTLEVVRKIGPFGNMCQALHGKYSLDEATGTMSWRAQYMLDDRGREVKPPDAATGKNDARVTYASDELLVMRSASAAQSYTVFSKLGKKALFKDLRDTYSIDTEMYLGPQ